MGETGTGVAYLGTVAALLGHKNLKTTLMYYGGSDPLLASRHFNRIVAELRAAASEGGAQHARSMTRSGASR